MRRWGCGVMLAAVALATGCSSTGRVVVQDGYRRTVPAAPRFESNSAGRLILAPEAAASSAVAAEGEVQ